MNEFVRSFRQFIYRDAFYILGGFTVLCSYFYSYTNWNEIATSQYARNFLVVAYIIGISYPIGYLTQAVFNVFRLTTSSIPDSPDGLTKWLFKRFRFDDCPTDGETIRSYETKVYKKLKDGDVNLARLERLVALKQMGTTLGPTFFISGLFIFHNSLRISDHSNNVQAYAPLLVVGILLIVFSRVKVMDQAQLIKKLH